MDWREFIHSDPGILGGKPVIRGTRISVELVLEYIADGCSIADVVETYPQICEAAVRPAVAFAGELVVAEREIAQQRAA
jgi:uncharacterized protein (DUF433 family)